MSAKIHDDQASQIMTRTEEIEAEKEAKRFEREQRKLEKERQKKRQFLEKLVAPILLFISIVISVGLIILKR